MCVRSRPRRRFGAAGPVQPAERDACCPTVRRAQHMQRTRQPVSGRIRSGGGCHCAMNDAGGLRVAATECAQRGHQMKNLGRQAKWTLSLSFDSRRWISLRRFPPPRDPSRRAMTVPCPPPPPSGSIRSSRRRTPTSGERLPSGDVAVTVDHACLATGTTRAGTSGSAKPPGPMTMPVGYVRSCTMSLKHLIRAWWTHSGPTRRRASSGTRWSGGLGRRGWGRAAAKLESRFQGRGAHLSVDCRASAGLRGPRRRPPWSVHAGTDPIGRCSLEPECARLYQASAKPDRVARRNANPQPMHPVGRGGDDSVGSTQHPQIPVACAMPGPPSHGASTSRHTAQART